MCSKQQLRFERERKASNPSPFIPAILLLAWLWSVTPIHADESAEAMEFFEKRIRPVLVEKCYSCHAASAKKIQGGLLLDSRSGTRRGGESGPAVVPGDKEKSLLLSAIRYEDFEMPPNERLPKEVVADFEKWIALGAPDPREGESAIPDRAAIDIDEGRKHWSFQPPTKPSVPTVIDTSWPRTNIDRFILSALESKGLKPVADAEAHEVRRRLAFDLTGLPPIGLNEHSIDEITKRLLDSPRFGERWGRHWLDVARYAESTSGGHNVLFPSAFRYRDWVIDAFNVDMPYDQFVREQIAGDLMSSNSDEEKIRGTIATGFLTVGIKDLRERDRDRFRMDMAEEQIDAIGRGFLGLTIACAKCHDHKFDPIPTRDFYALAGILISSEPMLGVRRNRERDPFAAGLIHIGKMEPSFTDQDVAGLLKERVDLIYARLDVRNEKWRIFGEMNKPTKNVPPELEAEIDRNPKVRELASIVETREARYHALLERYDRWLPDAAMGMRESTLVDSPIHIRGEDAQLGEVVPRGFLQVLSDSSTLPVNRNQSGRLELAEWLTSRRNPLTARVMVNRIWQHMFGVGLVETPDDFGKTGQMPSNPALLDYLAVRFIELDWSVKKLLHEIVDSRVYRLSSHHDAKAFELDPSNRLHWRMNRRRLDSDALMDAMRLISGTLVLQRPQPSFRPTPEQDDRLKVMKHEDLLRPTARYRTVYQPILRGYVPEDWQTFDFPDPELVVGRRGITTVPTQALFMMNNPFVVEVSAKTAFLLLKQKSSHADIVKNAYQRILGRSPSDDELAEGISFVNEFAVGKNDTKACEAFFQMLFATSEFRYLY